MTKMLVVRHGSNIVAHFPRRFPNREAPPNAMSQSVIGIKGNEPIGAGPAPADHVIC